MTPYYADESVTLYHGDCLDVLRSLPDASVDSVVTDPPYGLEFMGKDWDRFATGRGAKYAKGGDLDPENIAERSGKGGAGPSYVNRPAKRCAICGKQSWSGSPCVCPEPQWTMDNSPLHSFQAWCELWTAECLRVLKPGGHMLAFGGTRTWHRLACAVEDAGFEVRDSIAWLYGSGFPKSLDVSKAIDKAAGAEREVVRVGSAGKSSLNNQSRVDFGARPTVLDGSAFNITAPATPDARTWQGWGTALKPAFEPVVVARKPLVGTVAANVLEHGTGALNIDGCRIPGEVPQVTQGLSSDPSSWEHRTERRLSNPHASGRWPANVVLDEAQAEALDQQSGERPAGGKVTGKQTAKTGDSGIYGAFGAVENSPYDDTGGASRFFYVAKAGADERPRVNGTAHPTVKPLELMRWLVRLVTPPGGTVLEPFAGSGTTVEACIVERFQCIAIEREADYLPLIESRIARRRDPVKAITLAGEDLGLFGEASA